MSLKNDALFDVRGKYVFVSGGGRGIGRMITEGFASNGAVVMISSRKQKQCEDAARDISAATGGKVIALPSVDLATLKGVEECAQHIRAALVQHRGEAALDVLVNNSGVSWGEPLESFPELGWDKVMNTNVKAVFFLTRALVPLLEAAAANNTSHAAVINVGSIAGLSNQPYPTFSYDASKGNQCAAVSSSRFRLTLVLFCFAQLPCTIWADTWPLRWQAGASPSTTLLPGWCPAR